MSKEIKVGRTIGAAVAFSAVVLLTQNANAMSELEELMGGEPVEALSDNELDELRGGFSWGGMNFNFGFDAELRVSRAVLENVSSRYEDTIPQSVIREDEYENAPGIVSNVVAESIDGAPIVTSNSITNVSGGGVIETQTTTDAGSMINEAVLDDGLLSLSAGEGVVETPPIIPAADLPSSISEFDTPTTPTQQGVDEQVGSSTVVISGVDLVNETLSLIQDLNNANISMSRTVDVDITGFSMFDAMAARSRVESQITNVINSQVLFQLGQQF